MSDDIKTIVLDHGSGTVKVGFAGDKRPSTFPSIVGFTNDSKGKRKHTYIGKKACEKGDSLTFEYPIEHGITKNWDDVEKIWDFVFTKKLKVDPSEHPILITEAPQNPKVNREKFIEIMFEKYKVPSFYVAIQSVLCFYTLKQKTGIVCEIGDGVLQILPIYKGYSLPHAIARFNIGGHDITEWLQKILIERGNYFTKSYDKEIVRDIKEKLGYVAMDYDAELQKSKSTSDCDANYTLPNGNTITISDERFRCSELLFKPHMNGFELKGIDNLIFDQIMKCPIGMRKDLYSNIIVSGGSSMFKGFPERIKKEISNLAPPTMDIKVLAIKDRTKTAWFGGSFLASSPEFSRMAILLDEYNDAGPGIVHRKCF